MTKPSMSQYLNPEDFYRDLETYWANQNIESKDTLDPFWLADGDPWDDDLFDDDYDDQDDYRLDGEDCLDYTFE
jgi:hypothetical protein